MRETTYKKAKQLNNSKLNAPETPRNGENQVVKFINTHQNSTVLSPDNKKYNSKVVQFKDEYYRIKLEEQNRFFLKEKSELQNKLIELLEEKYYQNKIEEKLDQNKNLYICYSRFTIE